MKAVDAWCDEWFPVAKVAAPAALCPTLGQLQATVCDQMNSAPENVSHIFVLNLTYGGQCDRASLDESARMISDNVSLFPDTSVAIVVLPNVGPFGAAKDEDGVRIAEQETEARFSDKSLNLTTRLVMVLWDAASAYSSNRPLMHQVLLVASTNGNSRFSKSSLWRKRVTNATPMVPRADFVAPGADTIAADPTLSHQMELRQQVTGSSLWSALFSELFKGAACSHAVIVDLLPYDGTLQQYIMREPYFTTVAPEATNVEADAEADATDSIAASAAAADDEAVDEDDDTQSHDYDNDAAAEDDAGVDCKEAMCQPTCQYP
jgi:hypothetical protein